MDFQMYDCTDNGPILLLNDNRSKNWNLNNGMDNDEYFHWTNSLKIDETENNLDESLNKQSRKRKLIDMTATKNDVPKINQNNGYKVMKGDVQSSVVEDKKPVTTAVPHTNGTPRMPQWQVDDITDLNADIEGSLNGLGADHSNNSFNMSEAILSLSGMTVFKQEALSPTNNPDNTAVQYARQNTSPVTTQVTPATQVTTITEAHSNAMLNTTLHQLLSQSTYNIQNTIEGTLLNSPNNLSQDGYGVTSTNSSFTEDCRFQYVLAAATSIATKLNEDTLTYLNQGQSYEIKLKKLGDLSMYRGKLLKSVIRICFHERRLQYMEKEQMTSWQQSRPGDRILEVDVPLSYGLYDVAQPTSALNVVQFSWDPTKEVGAYIKVNCISTEFTPKKHGGEKGVPFRIQVETYQTGEGFDTPKRLHAAACQIKVFKLKGADRKHKQDREKILKRPITEQEKYQPSYDCTVLNDIPNDSVVATSPIIAPFSPECNSQSNNNYQPPAQQNQHNPPTDDKCVTLSSPASSIPNTEKIQADDHQNIFANEQLVSTSNPQQNASWLTANRFDKYLQTFTSFSGADMLRMTRDDLLQICGHADGIRLYNALHSKTIAPKLTIYVSRENTTVFNAIFLSSLNNCELLQKLASIIGVPQDQVRDIYIQGPQSIHIQLSNDVIQHIKEETMFQVEILQENGSYIFLLKHSTK